jgi:hypothetical protein
MVTVAGHVPQQPAQQRGRLRLDREQLLAHPTNKSILAEHRGLLKLPHHRRQQRRSGRGLVPPEQVQGLLTEEPDGRQVDAARVLEHPRQPLLAVKVGGDRRHPYRAGCQGGRVEQKPSPVHRNSHRLQRCHQAIQFGASLDRTRRKLLLGRIDQDE